MPTIIASRKMLVYQAAAQHCRQRAALVKSQCGLPIVKYYGAAWVKKLFFIFTFNSARWELEHNSVFLAAMHSSFQNFQKLETIRIGSFGPCSNTGPTGNAETSIPWVNIHQDSILCPCDQIADLCSTDTIWPTGLPQTQSHRNFTQIIGHRLSPFCNCRI